MAWSEPSERMAHLRLPPVFRRFTSIGLTLPDEAPAGDQQKVFILMVVRYRAPFARSGSDGTQKTITLGGCYETHARQSEGFAPNQARTPTVERW